MPVQRFGPPVRMRQASGRLRLAVAVLAVLNSVDLYLPVYIENTNEGRSGQLHLVRFDRMRAWNVLGTYQAGS